MREVAERIWIKLSRDYPDDDAAAFEAACIRISVLEAELDAMVIKQGLTKGKLKSALMDVGALETRLSNG